MMCLGSINNKETEMVNNRLKTIALDQVLEERFRVRRLTLSLVWVLLGVSNEYVCKKIVTCFLFAQFL